MKTYSGAITRLKPNQIFVFGSNTQGRHGKGAALWAKEHAGAIYGQARGLHGNSYAIVTKDISRKPYKSIAKPFIIKQIEDLYLTANQYPLKEFLVVYSGTGVNLNGYTPSEMALMFNSAGTIPDNVVFEENFAKLIQQSNCLF